MSGSRDIYPDENGQYKLFEEGEYSVYAAPMRHTGTVQYNIVRYSVLLCCGMVWYGVVRYIIVCYVMVWYSVVKYGI